MMTICTRGRLLRAGVLMGWLLLTPLGARAAVVEGLSEGAVAALKSPPDKLEAALREEIRSAWDKVAGAVLRESLADPDAVVVTKVWLDKVENKPFIQLFARGRTKDRKDRVVVEVFRGAGKEVIEQRYGKWFQPVTAGERSIKKEEFAGDRAALSTLTEDGSEALYWQTEDTFIDVRRPAEVQPLAKAVHEAAEKHGLYVFPEKVEAPVDVARCGGVAGQGCPEGYECKWENSVSEVGTCVKRTTPVPLVAGIACKAGDVCRETETGLPLRVLPRPFSNIYSSTQNGKVTVANVPTFHPLYVFGMEGVDASKEKGWYEVGQAVRDKPLGWMKAKDVLEWRQALIVAYTHPGSGEEARQRVLMFQELDRLRKVTEAPDAERAREAVQMYQKLRKKEVPEGVVSKETEEFVDITKKFYMMPVVNSEIVNLQGEEARYLQIAAAVPGARGEDRITKPEVMDDLTTRNVPGKEKRKLLGLDAVFVMDMTASMQPFMDRTKDALNSLAESLVQRFADDAELKDRIRFGLVGYRDDQEAMPGLEFTAKNFTPELVDAKGLAQILERDATATIVGSRDHPEEVFAGVNEAVKNTRWGDDTLKLLFVVGDASSHSVGDKDAKGRATNTTGLDAKSLRELADGRQIHIGAIHLMDPNHKEDHPIAEKQFKELTKVKGGKGDPAMVSVEIAGDEGFVKQVEPLAKAVAQLLDEYREGTYEPGVPTPGNKVPGEQLDRVTVRANTPEPVRSNVALESDKEYMIEASGEFSAWGGEPHGADPVWCYKPGVCDPTQLWDRLEINGRGMAEIAGGKDALPYNEGHTYRLLYKGKGKPIDLLIKNGDGESRQNHTGGFSVKILAVRDAADIPDSVRMLKKLFDAALVEYLGKETNPPKDIVAWVLDRDLTDPGVPALDVKVLLNREQLNDLVVALDTVLKGLSHAEMTQRQFFDALQSVAAQAEKDPERIARARKLKDAGLLPAFVESLPYKSEILEMSDASFGQMTAEQRSGLEQRLKAKLQQYREVNEQVDGWVKLNEQDERTKMVYPLPLNALP